MRGATLAYAELILELLRPEADMPRRGEDRRRYRRVQAPIFCRPAGVELFAQLVEAIDISLGGLRIGCHEEYPLGSVLELDVFFPQVAPVTVTAKVMWSQASSNGPPPRFDLGLAFVRVHPDVVHVLQMCLGSEDERVESRKP